MFFSLFRFSLEKNKITRKLGTKVRIKSDFYYLLILYNFILACNRYLYKMLAIYQKRKGTTFFDNKGQVP